MSGKTRRAKRVIGRGLKAARKAFCRPLLVAILISQLILPPGLSLLSHEARANGEGFRITGTPIVPQAQTGTGLARRPSRLSPVLEAAFSDPLIETLKAMPALPMKTDLTITDPTLDQDPFFLRGQRWVGGGTLPAVPRDDDALPPDIAYTQTATSFQLRFRGSDLAWEVSQPIHPIYSTGDYTILAANEENYFDRIRVNGEAAEGVFIVLNEELKAARATRARVPVYFFPLPGEGWTGPIDALAFPAQNLVVLLNEYNETLPIQENDIRTVIQAEKLNLMLAQGMTMRSRVLRPWQMEEAITPMRGSTAGFGVMFTGFDLEHPELNLFQRPTPVRDAMLRPVRWFLDTLGPRSAHADPAADAAAQNTEKLVNSMVWLGKVSAMVAIAAIVFKLTLFKKHFDDLHRDDPPATTWREWLARHIGDTGTVLAHNFAFVANVANVWFGNSVEFIIDRFLPHLGAGENSLLRKFLKETVFWTRDAARRLPVDLRTFLMGSGVLGGTDSLLVAVQLYFCVPWIAQGIATALPGLQERVDNAFDVNNPDTATYNRNEVVRNISAYIAKGASNYSGELKSQLLATLGPEVDSELRRLGMDPNDPSVKALRDAKLDELLKAAERAAGLPGREGFLFDAMSLWAYMAQLMGYQVPADMRGLVPAEARPGGLRPAVAFHGEQRNGLLKPAVDRALREARAQLRLFPADAAVRSEVRLLEKLSGNLSYLGNFVKYPMRLIVGGLTGRGPPWPPQMVRIIRETRQQIIALTYDGPVNEELWTLPGDWCKEFGEPGAWLAGQRLRRAFFSLMRGDDRVLTGPTNADRQATLGETGAIESDVRRILDARYSTELAAIARTMENDTARASAELARRHAAEFRLLCNDRILARVNANRADAIPFEPPARSWFQRLQEDRARWVGDERWSAAHNNRPAYTASTPAELAARRRFFAEAMLEQAGIYPDYDVIPGLRERVEGKAEELTRAQIEAPKMRAYLATLRPGAATELTASIYAENLILAYRDIVPNIAFEEAQRRFKERHGEAYNPSKRAARGDAEGAALIKQQRKDFREFFTAASLSTAQPGRFQWLRQKKWVRNSRFLTRMVRAVESLVPVEAHASGLTAMLSRNVPIVHDAITGFIRSLRTSITGGIAIYWFDYFFWGTGLPLSTWLLSSFLLRFTVLSPMQFLNRFSKMEGLQPMSSVAAMLGYAFVYSWFTFWGSLPATIFNEDFKQAIEPIQKEVGEILGRCMNGGLDVVQMCKDFIADRGRAP